MSSVRVEADAFTDSRYAILAQGCGLADADHARSKMERLWWQCTQERRYVLPADDVIHVLGTNAISAIVRARLGEVVPDGIRICGTKGRIEWLEKLRKNGKKGGRPKKTKQKPSGYDESNPPAPAPAPAPAHSDSENTQAGGEVDLLGSPLRVAKPRPSRRAPIEFTPGADHIAFASEHRLDLAMQLAKFLDHEFSKPRSDWAATFRNWLREAAERSRGNTLRGVPPARTGRSEPKPADEYGKEEF